MSLVADYSDSSSSSFNLSASSNEEIEEENTKGKSDICKEKVSKLSLLPSANQQLTGNATANKKTGDVFSNPFLDAEKAETALLEQHVKMVSKDEHLMTKNGRKICWNYRRGRCRFGSNCHYAHDSDLSVDATAADTSERDIRESKVAAATGSKHTISGSPCAHLEETALAGSECNIDSKKRKRPGLSDTIKPNKRVLKAYSQQQQQGRKQQLTRHS